MKEVGGAVCEREELISCIAIALLTRKNLFVLGDVGQAKSYAIDLFCKKDIAVSDRTFFNFGEVVQAEAFLCGRDEVIPADMLALKNYLWNKPEEQTVITEVLRRLCENPVGDKLNELTVKAFEVRDAFGAETDKNRALIPFKTGLLALYDEALQIKDNLTDGDAAISSVDSFIGTLEDISRNAFSETSFTYVTLPELKEYQKLSA